MANDKKINSRVQQKYDTQEHWDKANGFIPLAGEIIIYTDIKRFKIGDGVTPITQLDFFNGITQELEDTLTDYATLEDLTVVYDELSVSCVDWDSFEEALYGEDSDIVNNQDLEQILSDYPTFGDVETYLTTSVDEGGIKETLVVTVIESEDFNARVSSSFYWELEGIAASEPDSEERRIFAETVLAVLPVYNGEYSVEVV